MIKVVLTLSSCTEISPKFCLSFPILQTFKNQRKLVGLQIERDFEAGNLDVKV